MRPGEAMALRWSEVDSRSRRAKVCRIRLYGKIKERTKTKVSREVLLNDRALQALEKARLLTAARSDYVFAPDGSGDRSELYIRSETGAKRYWLSALRKSGIRYRRMYDTRHTYATMCLMSGMNPAYLIKMKLTKYFLTQKIKSPFSILFFFWRLIPACGEVKCLVCVGKM